jgi:predicted nuclease of restriction endonuclease-like (RecB) superfamily
MNPQQARPLVAETFPKQYDKVRFHQFGLIDHLQSFLLELGTGFAFVARQMCVSTETKDFYIDLVFYNYLKNA